MLFVFVILFVISFIPSSAKYFLKVIAHFSLKVATSGFLRCKTTSKMSKFDANILNKNGVVRSK